MMTIKWTKRVGFILTCCIYSVDCLVSALAKGSEASCQDLNIDLERLIGSVVSGRVYQHQNFLTEEEVQTLLRDIDRLEKEGCFEPSGLSNTVKGTQQGFGKQDRTTCSVPWWGDALRKQQQDTPGGMATTKLQRLRGLLADVLDRPTLLSLDLPHECYYSQSGVGSFLPRHMDERHEELKGSKGWLLSSRRSLSWLIYLSDFGWDLETNGGALRSFPQTQAPQSLGTAGSTHHGNLQVAWLAQPNGSSQRVYLDSFYPVPLGDGRKESHCILYVVESNGERRFLTKPWLNDALAGISAAQFLRFYAERHDESNSLFLSSQDAQRFALLEDREAWEAGYIPTGSQPEDISPERGSLVLFDSVLVPHEVSIVKAGTRIALAGWFHEETQPLPESELGTTA